MPFRAYMGNGGRQRSCGGVLPVAVLVPAVPARPGSPTHPTGFDRALVLLARVGRVEITRLDPVRSGNPGNLEMGQRSPHGRGLS